MVYAKNKTTQRDFVLAWWKEADRKAIEALKHDYPGIETVSFFDGMPYADKLRHIPNNALRRAGLKPRRRNGERKKKAELSQAAKQKIQLALNFSVYQITERKIPQLNANFAEFPEIRQPIEQTPLEDAYKAWKDGWSFQGKFDTRLKMWVGGGLK